MNDKILKSNGRLLHFYFKNGIYVKDIKNQEIKPTLIFEDAYYDFDVVCDFEDNIYLICQDKSGSVICFSYTENKWISKTLLLCKTKTAYNKSFKLFSAGRLTFCVYSIVKDAKSLLVLHCINENLTPVVIDYITPSPRSFFVYVKENYDIFVYYSDSRGILGFKQYQWSKKEFLPFFEIEKGAVCPFLTDCGKLLYILNGKIFLKDEDSTHEIYSSSSEISPPVYFKSFIIFKKDLAVYCIKYKSGDGLKKLSSPTPTSTLFEIKTSPFATVYLYGAYALNNIHLLSPEKPLKPDDFYKNEEHKKEDRLEMILKRLDKIEKMLGGIR